MNRPIGSIVTCCCVLLLLIVFPVELSATESSTNASNDSLIADSFKSEPNWHQHQRRCFDLSSHNRTFTFDEARAECNNYEADLASIEDAAAQNVIADLLSKRISSPGIDRRVWIGAQWNVHENHDDHEGGGWHWMFTENSLNYSNWASPTPTGPQPGQCAVIEFNDGKWRSVNCTETVTLLLCERDLERPIRKDKNMAWALMYALLGLLLIGLLCGCCVYCIVTRNRDRRRGDGSKFRGIYYKRSSAAKKPDNGNV